MCSIQSPTKVCCSSKKYVIPFKRTTLVVDWIEYVCTSQCTHSSRNLKIAKKLTMVVFTIVFQFYAYAQVLAMAYICKKCFVTDSWKRYLNFTVSAIDIMRQTSKITNFFLLIVVPFTFKCNLCLLSSLLYIYIYFFFGNLNFTFRIFLQYYFFLTIITPCNYSLPSSGLLW